MPKQNTKLILLEFAVQGTGVNCSPPIQVAKFHLHSSIINQIIPFYAHPKILRAFPLTEIQIIISGPNDQIPNLTNLSLAK